MTINELIENLQKLPETVREQTAHIYIAGTISGYVEIDSVNEDEDYPGVTSVNLREQI